MLGICIFLYFLASGINRYRLLTGSCVPRVFPDGKRTIDKEIIQTESSFEKVTEYFNQELDVLFTWDRNIESDSRWYLEKIAENQYLYSCYSLGKSNYDMLGQMGCINIIDHRFYVTVESFFAETSDNYCNIIEFEVSP